MKKTCGYTGNRAREDTFVKLPGVRRHVPGNAVCLKCGSPIPYNTAR